MADSGVEKVEIWKYLIDDFLEMACGLAQEDRCSIIEALKFAGLNTEAIQPRQGLLIGTQWILPCPETAERVWIFDPKEKKIQKIRIAEIEQA